MTKFIVFVFAAICFANANPIGESGIKDYSTQYTNYPNWPALPTLPKLHYSWIQIPTMKPLTPQDIANMKPVPGGIVTGVSTNLNSETDYINGKPVTKVQGETTWNNNGDVEKKIYKN